MHCNDRLIRALVCQDGRNALLSSRHSLRGATIPVTQHGVHKRNRWQSCCSSWYRRYRCAGCIIPRQTYVACTFTMRAYRKCVPTAAFVPGLSVQQNGKVQVDTVASDRLRRVIKLVAAGLGITVATATLVFQRHRWLTEAVVTAGWKGNVRCTPCRLDADRSQHRPLSC